MDGGRKKGGPTRKKLKKGMEGAISVFLCLILTPILTVTLSLIEYARYQEAMEIADEIMELVGLSPLDNYDEYLQKRFGLLAVSQDGDMSSDVQDLADTNAKLLGDQIVFTNVKVQGASGLTLGDNDILKQQLMDVSELTGTTAILLDDFQLQNIIDTLQGVSKFQKFMDGMSKTADTTEALGNVVQSVSDLVDYLKGLKNDISELKNMGGDLLTKAGALFNTLRENGLTITGDMTPDQIAQVVADFQASYLDDLEEIYTKGKELVDKAEKLSAKIGEAKGKLEAVKSSVKTVEEKIKNLKDESGGDDDGVNKAVAPAATTLDSVAKAVDKALSDSMDSLMEGLVNEVKDLGTKLKGILLDNLGLTDNLISKYDSIKSGEYFKVDEETGELSAAAKSDIEAFLKTAAKIVAASNAEGAEDPATQILSYLKERGFVPSVDADVVDDLVSDLEDAVKSAGNSLKDTAKTTLTELLTKLVNLGKKIISITVFSDPSLNEIVSFSGDRNAGTFVDAIEELLDAVDELKSGLGSLNFVKAAVAFKKAWDAVADIGKGLLENGSKFVTGIMNTFSGGAENIIKNIYRKFVLSGYAVHNFPSRVDAGELLSPDKVKLSGTGLTGFDFNDIPRGKDAGSFDGAEVEYIYSGTRRENVNQTLAFVDIYIFRLLLDLPSVFVGEVSGIAASATIAAPIVYLIYILLEPFVDTIFLVNGEMVPLAKTKCWLTPTGIPAFSTTFLRVLTKCEDIREEVGDEIKNQTRDIFDTVKSDPPEDGMGLLDADYVSHILILMLFLKDENDIVERIENLMELEAKAYYKGKSKTFEISKTYVAVNVTADAAFSSFFALGSSDALSGSMSRTLAY